MHTDQLTREQIALLKSSIEIGLEACEQNDENATADLIAVNNFAAALDPNHRPDLTDPVVRETANEALIADVDITLGVDCASTVHEHEAFLQNMRGGE